MAVSPVVGVMLMLVVTIIIAAVVSGFAGGLFGGNSNQKTPTLAMDVKIENSTSGLTFSGTVLSTSEPISTNKLKLSTSWAKNATIFGGNETTTVVPYGFGPGISGDSTLVKPYNSNQYFGNYTLTQGTGLVAEPSDINMILGSKYSSLSPGDTVNVKIVYVPTGKMVFQKDVIVTGV
ncbi:MAG: type IV pilin N-terminal domain-containing protein [Methanoregula sp.]|nr:type IV pilin N-terminal domain-containing protein [Methanoregula sp.]